MMEAFKRMDSGEFNLDTDLDAPIPELVKGPILPCVIGMVGSAAGFMKVTIHQRPSMPVLVACVDLQPST